MADTVRVDPEVLCRAGGLLAGHGEALLAAQRGCAHDVEVAVRSGWVGASATALAELLDGWAVATGRHAGRLAEHADGLRTSAAALRNADHVVAE